jgi:hypothetical protein
VNRVQPQAVPMMDEMRASGVMAKERPQFQEESFFEYHLYTLERKATIQDNQTKQIELLSAEDAKTKKTYVVSPQQSYWFYRFEDTEKPKVGVYISVENSKKNQMGMPLPKGTVRVYKQDKQGALQFIGEDSIDHTPEDETIRVKMGDAFDVIAERVQTSFEVLSSGHLYRSAIQGDAAQPQGREHHRFGCGSARRGLDDHAVIAQVRQGEPRSASASTSPWRRREAPT